MSEKRKRNSYSPEFKAKVGLEAIHGVKSLNEIGQAYGVHPVQVNQWNQGSAVQLRVRHRRLLKLKQSPVLTMRSNLVAEEFPSLANQQLSLKDMGAVEGWEDWPVWRGQ